MNSAPSGLVTRLLDDVSAGSHEALDRLLPYVYGELRRRAAAYLRKERVGHTLQPTALVHEAWIRLVDQRDVRWQNRAHFFAIAAQAMRRILVDYARTQQRAKRGGGARPVTLVESSAMIPAREVDLVALDEALTRLAAVDSTQSRLVELRFFGGLTVEETAAVMGTSPATVKREWTIAKAWLHHELNR
jgi:RNA polymerase sigma factor (TIGR02999 family)